MTQTFGQVKEHLSAMAHGGTLNKVRNIEAMFERAASIFLSQAKPLETMRLGTLDSTVHDDFFNYALPNDYNSIIDLFPQDERHHWDKSFRRQAENFDLKKLIKDQVISIEGDNGVKFIRINWRSRKGKVLHSMNSVDSNGTWVAVGDATGIQANSIFKITGSASIEFDLVTTGDGIQNTTMGSIDMTDEDEVADVFVWVYMPTVLTSVTANWGNDLITNFWTSVAQTVQSDGTAFKIGWNLLKFPWSTATETGTVDPTAIDSFSITMAGTAPINNIRVDNIVFSIGRNFDIKYHSKFLFRDALTSAYQSRPLSDDDIVLIDNDSLPLFLFELLQEMAQQMEGVDSTFDINFAMRRLETLYPTFRSEYPDQRKKAVATYGNVPRWNNSYGRRGFRSNRR